MSVLSLRDILFVCICTLIHYTYRHRRRPILPYPPGLPRWPIVGNAFSFPLTYMHVFFKKLGDRLGTKIVYMEALGRQFIVLNDVRMAKDLLEKRSELYSSRPAFPMLLEVCVGFPHLVKSLFGTMPYGDEWRSHRRIFQQYFSPKNHYRVEERAMEFVRKGLLPSLFKTPQDVHGHVRSCMGGFSTSLTYGLPIHCHGDPLVLFAEDVFTKLALAGAPGKYLVNLIPQLKHIPDWMPGTDFKRAAHEAHDQAARLLEEPFQEMQNKMDEGTLSDCFVLESLDRNQSRPDFELQTQHIKQTAMQIYGVLAAASETTVAATMTFILAMLICPDVQRRAQQELDSVVGTDRLPDFSDKPNLPYLSAIIKEVLRWNPATPMGVPHLTTDEDVYEGYYIPKGCIIFANSYAMLHDETIFPSPTEFKPERFIKNGIISDDVPDPESVATFGFGRRVCPGSDVALSLIYITAASILAAFDILPALDEKGDPIKVVPEFISASLISEPLPFKCKFTPRQGKDVEGLLKEYLNFVVI
ncbi:cytochrome P450 [Macrolepiota fuliginosa MF-IS2]|uniref:Cytochrome P450 n=1 Tax=Macrolepiota fuliginosa MF-IS2 TaxID=1400762 RepID=A0A9P5X5Q8_9AGAR|nr:cytochrome P450 [Macrolepiota fuliginosa MF-IS2]